MKRKTIKQAFEVSGKGLHKGKNSKLVFKPTNGSGIRFINLKFSKPIEASIENVHSTLRGTNLTNGKDIVYTVEHILSALSAFSIDDVDIEIEGDEPPALDGSAKIYADLIKKSQIQENEGEEIPVFNFSQEINFQDKESIYKISKSNKFEIECLYENPHPLIGKQKLLIEINPETYEREIAPARTFGFEKEIEYLKKNNLALGGSLENAIVLTENGIMNKEPLRYPDEFVRHKILDLLGDLKLSNLKFENIKITALKPSHNANINFVKFIRSINDKKF